MKIAKSDESVESSGKFLQKSAFRGLENVDEDQSVDRKVASTLRGGCAGYIKSQEISTSGTGSLGNDSISRGTGHSRKVGYINDIVHPIFRWR